LFGLERVRAAIIRHQRPAAVVTLLRRTSKFGEAEPGSIAYSAVNAEAVEYFTSQDAREQAEVRLAAAG
jgi:hypothetical protein